MIHKDSEGSFQWRRFAISTQSRHSARTVRTNRSAIPFARSARSGARHFRRAVCEFVAHDHGERNHQGLQNRLITGAAASGTVGRVRRRSRQ